MKKTELVKTNHNQIFPMSNSLDFIAPYKGRFFTEDWPTIPALFQISQEKFPQRNCFTTFEPDRISLTYNEVGKHLEAVSSFLQEVGIKKGDRVIINGKNSPAWGIAYLSSLYAGAIVVPLDNMMLAEKVDELAAFCEAAFIFADSDVLSKLKKDALWVKNLKGMATLKGPTTHAPDILSLEPKALLPQVECTQDDLAAILFTSGTTGNEKGAMLTHANIVSNVLQACDGVFLNVSEQDVFYALLPLHHSYCCTAVFLESIKHGAECVFGTGIVVSKMLNDMKKGGVTVFMGIPLLFNKLLNGLMKKVRERGLLPYTVIKIMLYFSGVLKKRFKINVGRSWFKAMLEGIGMNKNRLCICGAGPLSPGTFNRFQQLGLDFVQGYGLTETSPIITLNPVSHFKVKSIGRYLPLIDLKILDPDLFGIGEIAVKGPNITQGYYKDPENTAALFTEDGYLKTGDLASIDREGYLYLKGRAKNVIVTEGGKNVYPEEIEDAFQLYNQIDQIIVRSYLEKKDVKAEGIEAVIYPSPDYYQGKQLTDSLIRQEIEKLVKEVNQKLVAYKKITKITIVDKPMAMTSTKKIQRNKVLRTVENLLHSSVF